MRSTGFPAPTSVPTSMSAPGATLDRPEAEIDRPEVILPSRPTGMVLRSQSRAGWLEVLYARIYIQKDQGLYSDRNWK